MPSQKRAAYSIYWHNNNQSFYNKIYSKAMTYYRILHEIEVQNALRRSLLEQQVATERLRRSRIDAAIELETVRRQAQIEAETAIRRSRVEAEIQASRAIAEASLRRSRAQAEILLQKEKAEESIRRSRIQAKVECDRLEREAVLRRSRLDTSIRRDLVSNIIDKSRLESELQQARLHQQRNLNQSLRRSRIEAENQRLSRRH